jgi:hypothetical protein
VTSIAGKRRVRAFAVLAATAAGAVTVPSLAHAATLRADPVQRCYRERDTVGLRGSGFTPNAVIDFTRDGLPVPVEEPIEADAAGGFVANLTLRGMASGQRRFSYAATDPANPAVTAELALLVTATGVSLEPKQGAPDRLLTIRARGFLESRRLWAHIVRRGGGRSRNLRIGRVRGACGRVRARRRIFSAGVPAGRYRVQFDNFRRYRRKREVQSAFRVTIMNPRGRAAAGAPGLRESR